MAVLTPLSQRTNSAVAHSSRRGFRILFVEDDPDTSSAMARLLTCCGHQVRTAASIGEATAAWNGEDFDLLITDIGLPDGSGLSLPAMLADTGRPRAIVISGFGSDEDLHASRDAGFREHLVKPVSFAALQASIRAVME